MSERLGAAIARANLIIGDATPLSADCGALCGAACCHGDADAGMLLFPGEMPMLSQVANFRLYRIRYMGGRAWHLSCDGTCDRETRPLACRIFPLAPYVDGEGKVSAVPDPRARRMCPLADGSFLDRRFERRVARAFEYLAEEPRMLEFMGRLSRELEELRRFYPQ